MIKVVLFDFYGVFLPDAYSAWLESNGLKREGIFAEIINELDQDKIAESEFLRKLSTATGRSVANGEIHIPNLMPDADVIALARDLRKTHTVGLFSNASKGLRTKLENLGLNTLFDSVIISGEIGHAKPSSEAFDIAIKELGVSANEILFIDDNPANIEAAKRSGIAPVHYTGAVALRESLSSHQII